MVSKERCADKRRVAGRYEVHLSHTCFTDQVLLSSTNYLIIYTRFVLNDLHNLLQVLPAQVQAQQRREREILQ